MITYFDATVAAGTERKVIYRAPGWVGMAPAEEGVIVRLSSDPAYAFVRYAGDSTPKATRLADLEWMTP